MSRLNDIQQGIAEAFGIVMVATLALFFLLGVLAVPSAALLRDIANVGTALLLAYVLETVWLTSQMRSVPDYERRLGAFVGLGATALVGIAVSLMLAAHREAGHANLLDQFGLSWVIVSLAMLGGIVVVQPLLVHEWGDKN